jgi:hypothetical protein
MTFDVLSHLNWLAVLVAALAYFAVGALWYAPKVFGTVWATAGGIRLPERGTRPSPAMFVTPLIGSALSASAMGCWRKLRGPTP